MKETEEDTNKWNDILYHVLEEIIVKMSILLKATYSIQSLSKY